MSRILDRLLDEPVLVTTLVSAATGLVVAFGLDLTGEQTGAITAVVAAIMAIVARSQVTPTRKVAAHTVDADPAVQVETVAGPAAELADEGEPVQVVPDPEYGEHGVSDAAVAIALGFLGVLLIVAMWPLLPAIV